MILKIIELQIYEKESEEEPQVFKYVSKEGEYIEKIVPNDPIKINELDLVYYVCKYKEPDRNSIVNYKKEELFATDEIYNALRKVKDTGILKLSNTDFEYLYKKVETACWPSNDKYRGPAYVKFIRKFERIKIEPDAKDE